MVNWPWNGYVNWYDAATPRKLQYALHTDREIDFYPTLNRVEFDAVHTAKEGELAVRMVTFAPDFDGFEINVDDTGWRLDDHTMLAPEVPVAGYDPTPWNGVTDYCLYAEDGTVLAVIEAKRTCRNPRDGEEQLRAYIDAIARSQPSAPFGFMTNGLLTYFWEVGLAHPRMVAGFFTRDDLNRLRFIREKRQPLAA